MRPRLAVLSMVVTTLLAVAVPSVVTAAPRHNRGLTVNAIPSPIDHPTGSSGVHPKNWLMPGVCTTPASNAPDTTTAATAVGSRPPTTSV